MLLVVDVGNTQTHLGAFQGESLVQDWRFATVRETVNFPPESSNIEDLLSRCQSFLDVHEDVDVRSFIEEAEGEIARLCRFVTPQSDLDIHVSFLQKFARRAPGQARVESTPRV